MNRIHSMIEPSQTLAVIGTLDDATTSRQDLCDVEDPIQFSIRTLSSGLFVSPHKHLPIQLNTNKRMEVWIVLTGKVQYEIYDLNDELIVQAELIAPGFAVFFGGGHSLRVLEQESIFFEIKTGPYKGVENDKQQIA